MSRWTSLALLGLATVLLVSAHPPVRPASSLIVDKPPKGVQPYVLPKQNGKNSYVGDQVFRISVPGECTDGIFTFYEVLNVQPHYHDFHFETFRPTRGRMQLWTQPLDEPENLQSRSMSAGDFVGIPPKTIHTFRMMDLESHYSGVITPGFFEDYFFHVSRGWFETSTGADHPAVPVYQHTAPTSHSQEYDVYSLDDFHARNDFDKNGVVGSGNWHNGTNSLGKDAHEPYFLALGWAPKYLNTEGGMYKLISPQVTLLQSGGNFTMGTITLSTLLANQTAPSFTVQVHTAIQVDEGELVITFAGEEATLIVGDIAFIPANTPFTWYAQVPQTKILYVSGGKGGMDEILLEKSIAWDYAVYPHFAGFDANAKCQGSLAKSRVVLQSLKTSLLGIFNAASQKIMEL
ncbi:RmlC-like cupin domain-containing protein [Xylogone sp. PMI_703]|nr:RmlC-like cupin domain-containing protein [Xylogone sp. PMI_703]